MNKRIPFLMMTVIFSFVLLLACGGGDDGGDVPPATPAVSMEGIWTGTFYSNVTASYYQIIGITSESNESHFISDWGAQYIVSNPNISGNSFSATAKGYAPIGETFPDGSSSGSISVSGTCIEMQSITGTYSGLGDNGTISLSYSTLYERASSLSKVSGAWAGLVNGYIQSISIDSSGNIIGADTSGCVYAGNVSIINATYNVYGVNINVSSCGSYNGTYAGLATLGDTSAMDDTLYYGVHNNAYSIVGKLM